MYKGLFDIKAHKSALVNLNNIERVKYLQDGFYDKHILCAECDNNLLSKLENYASKFLYGSIRKEDSLPKYQNLIGEDGLKFTFVTNLNYTNIKLFLLSILWRAHISKQSFFNQVDLGPYAEVIRMMLLNNDAGNEDRFETCILKLIPEDSIKYSKLYKSIAPPRKLKDNQNVSYVFHINNFLYMFNISSIAKLNLFEAGKVRKDNTMQFAILDGKFGYEFFCSFLQIKPTI